MIKRTPKRVYQRVIHTSDGQRMNWPPKALALQHNSSGDLTRQASMPHVVVDDNAHGAGLPTKQW